jgi:hypothetical protein
MIKKTKTSMAPVLISVYNRIYHFRKCIESLSKNIYADDTKLFIAIDAPYRDEDIASNKQVIKYAKEIKGFQNVEIIIRNSNLGSVENIMSAWDEIYQIYNKLIFSEDDNIYSEYFLDYMNNSLDIFQEREDIFAVCGYNYPVKIPLNYKHEIYLWQGVSAWGLGTWKDKWYKMPWDFNQIKKWLKDKNHIKKLNAVAHHYKYALKTMYNENRIDADGYISSYMIQEGKSAIFPVNTYVKNLGHDGSGNNQHISKRFLKQKITDKKIKLVKDIAIQKDINKSLFDYFSNKNRFIKRIASYFYK